jgi:hypothetical protein
VFPFSYQGLIEGIPGITKQVLRAKYYNVIFTEKFGSIKKGTKFNYLDVSVNKPYLMGYIDSRIIRIPYVVKPTVFKDEE